MKTTTTKAVKTGKTLILCFIFSHQFISFSQNNSQPTNQEAIDFISKVYFQYPNMLNKMSYKGMEIKNCHLRIASVEYDVQNSYTDNVVYKTMDTLDIDLSNVKLDGRQIIALQKGSIILKSELFHSKRLNVYEHSDWTILKYKKFTEQIFDKSSFDIVESEDQVFIANNYGPRLQTAFKFIIKTCGGGKLNVDSNEKF